MGYRSDVRIITSKKGYDRLSKYVRKAVNDDIDMNLLENTDLKCVSSSGVLIGWNSIKWYEWSDYKSVDAIMDGLNVLKDEGYSYRYARMGEQYDDYDEYNYDSNKKDDEYIPYIYVSRYFDDDEIKNELSLNIKKNNNKELSDEKGIL